MDIPPSFEFQVSSLRIGNSPFMQIKFIKGVSHGFIMENTHQNSSNNNFPKICNMICLLDVFPKASTFLESRVGAVARSWFHFLVPLRKSETHFQSANQERICVIDGTFGITQAQTEG